MKRSKIYFTVNGEVVCEETTFIDDFNVNEMKWKLAIELEVSVYDIDVEIDTKELSNIDIDSEGNLFDWRDCADNKLDGIKCNCDIDTLLDAISKKEVVEYLEFSF